MSKWNTQTQVHELDLLNFQKQFGNGDIARSVYDIMSDHDYSEADFQYQAKVNEVVMLRVKDQVLDDLTSPGETPIKHWYSKDNVRLWLQQQNDNAALMANLDTSVLSTLKKVYGSSLESYLHSMCSISESQLDSFMADSDKLYNEVKTVYKNYSPNKWYSYLD